MDIEMYVQCIYVVYIENTLDLFIVLTNKKIENFIIIMKMYQSNNENLLLFYYFFC